MVEQALLVLQVVFLVLLYLFIWRVVRLSLRDVRPAQESMVIGADAAAAAGLGRALEDPAAAEPAVLLDLRVVAGPAYPVDTRIRCEHDLVIGRAADVDVPLAGDGAASGRHARILRRGADVYLEDLGSTNGTWVNGQRLVAERLLRVGDRVRVGETELVVEREAA